MGLRGSPYASRFLRGLDAVANELLYPSYWLLSQILALQRTTAEKQEPRSRTPHALAVLAKGPLLLLLFLLSVPLSLLALLLWLPVQAARRPFAYLHTPSRASPEEWVLPGQGRAFRFVTANICLLPDGLAKFSNLARTQWRAMQIAQALVQAARRAIPTHEDGARSGACRVSRGRKYGATESSPPRACENFPAATDGEGVTAEGPRQEGKAALPWEITASFPPDVDFLCLQEVFDQEAAKRLLRLLGPCFEHIVYDVGTYGLLGCSALKLLNSGLLLASRYPVRAVQYHCYPNATGEDAFSAKGLLCVQVQLGASQGQRIVGYLNSTHLHAPETDGPVRCDQLTMAVRWALQFQETHAQPGDLVAFDIFCGDLNFDNCSPDDKMEQAHELFSLYTDPCRIGPGRDKPWALGTLMNPLTMYDEAVATPETMKRTLEHSEGRQKYLAGPLQTTPCSGLSAIPSEGRRIDYILYREHQGPAELKTVVERVSFITHLATCSDHMPVGLQLRVAPAAQPEA
ncbi:PREDICTED: sphingomyelin phosphodiesterase 3 [Gekko japonicus]|uniref:sphingomyelin phosphodiesterase n=1 Tax=Gekko japonicus TaxID=146911 RepID=A0ABM1KFH7_GEKJA|nr:PREDICTED: sphingomyelin phosphodiesterase 3 [Gekko japonicus]